MENKIPLTLCLIDVTLAAGTTSTVSTTGTTHYAINGKAYTVAALTNQATPTADANGNAFTPISANQGTVYVLGFNAAGTLQAMQGQVQALDTSGNFIYAPQFPTIPDTMCPIGYIVLKGGATLVGTWVLGTDNLSGVTGMTYSFTSVMALPDRPQVA